MKRDPRLRPFSNDHHRALVMARKIGSKCESCEIDHQFIDELKQFCHHELEPHFALEERLLLPVLQSYGEQELVDRTLSDHKQILATVSMLDLENIDALMQLSLLLKQHVRFEERLLFEAIERNFSESELDRISRP